MNIQRPIFERYMDRLSVEVTRRCNLNCDFCARGKAQPIDITREIIDKTLDELSNTLIGSLRLSGGEPFMNPKAITYLFEQIIERRIRICSVEVFTNGTLVAPELAETFERMIAYIKDFENEYPYLHRWFWRFQSPRYDHTQNKKIAIVISNKYHGEAKTSEAFNYWKKFNGNDFSIVLQDEAYLAKGDITITLEGNAKANCKELLGDNISIGRVRMLDNQYYLIEEIGGIGDYKVVQSFASCEAIMKSITVSANGNLFPGCIMGYDRVDKEAMFNIAECDKDFFYRVKEWCWEHPLCKKAVDIKAERDAWVFCNENGIAICDRDADYMRVSEWAIGITENTYLPFFKQIHERFPFFGFEKVELLATAKTVLCLYDLGVSENYIHAYLLRCSKYSKEVVGSPTLCHNIIDELGILSSIVDDMTGYNLGLI